MCVECLSTSNCIAGVNSCNIPTCTADHTCEYSTPDCSVGGTECSVDCCDPETGCVHTPSNNNCSNLTNECNVGFCSENGCDSQPLTGQPCSDPSTCGVGICVLGVNSDTAGCFITNPCIAPDSCSEASCDRETGHCSITSECCPGLCDNESGECRQCDSTHPCPDDLLCVNGTCIQCASNSDCRSNDECIVGTCKANKCEYTLSPDCDECHEDDHDHRGGHGHGGGPRGGFGPVAVPIPVPVATPVPEPVPVATPVATPVVAPVPTTTVVAEPVVTPVNNPASASGGVKDSALGSKEDESGSSCATTGAGPKDLWMWMMMLAGVYSIRRKNRAQATN